MIGVQVLDWLLRGCLGALYLIAFATAVVVALFLTARFFEWGDE